jgi:hypothetical protein
LIRRTPIEHGQVAKRGRNVLFSLLAGLIASSAVAQSVNPTYTLRARATSNPLELFRTESELPKGHGLLLDDKHRVKLYEDDGWIVLALETNQRAPGGPHEFNNPESMAIEVATRFDEEYDLFRMGAQVLAPAPPNYVRNPGRRYKITIEGLGVAPMYKTQFEVDAANALDAVATEIHKLSAAAKGLEVPCN